MIEILSLFAVFARLVVGALAVHENGHDEHNGHQQQQVARNNYRTLVIIIVFVLLVTFWLFTILRRPLGMLSHIPGPPSSHLLLGNVTSERGKTFLRIQEWVAQYGTFTKYMYGRLPRVVLSEPDLVHEVLVTNFENFVNRTGSNRLMDKTGSKPGLLMARDDYWRRLRRIVSPAFNTVHLKTMLTMINSAADLFIEHMIMVQETGEVGGGKNGVVEIHNALARLTLEIIGTTAFGTHIPSQTDSSNELSLAASAVFRATESGSSALLPLAVFPGLAPLMSEIVKKVKPKALVMFVKAASILKQHTTTIIEERRRTFDHHHHGGGGDDDEDDDEEGPKDFVDMLLKAKDDKTGQRLQDDEIAAQCETFLLAGHETTATALAFTVYLLSRHPEVEQRMVEEIFRMFPDGTVPTTMDDLKQGGGGGGSLAYTTMVLNESLRLYPPAVRISRQAMHDIMIGNHLIPAEIDVVIPIWTIHHDKNMWGDDADEFKPERWLAPPSHVCAFMPFGGGPRNCVGMRFAVMEAKMLLVRIYQKLTFKLLPGQVPLAITAGITLAPEHGILVKPMKRVR
eukprot:TRINITY_DN3191_c1_g1_i2.p1 TRINITY_DN3191_c1_g1~~TRINITY_DN3191_c1_g1_i2.p1  ORF type:complete len:569 (-),score=92.10 TRINITY_DN3191_c1_g1_i2:56-1762(-)